MPKPRVFIGSSTEGLPVARAVEFNLKDEIEAVLWKNVFDPSKTTIENLEQNLDTVEFAVLIITPDDLRTKRETTSEVPRDNVVFELGLYMGRLGRDRTFLVKVENGSDPQLPTDLLGITVVSVKGTRSDDDVAAALSPAAFQISRAIKKTPRRQPTGDRSAGQGFLLDRDQFLDAIASWPPSSRAISIALPDTAWAWELFPTLLCWRLTRTPVLVYTLPPHGNANKIRQEQSRRGLLGKLGIKVEEVENIERSGAFRKTESVEEDCAIICNENAAEGVPFAIQYDGMIHSQVAISLMERVPLPQSSPADAGPVPQLVGYDAQDVIERLRKGVHQYSSPGVDLHVSKVKTTGLYLMSSFVRSFKYRQIELLFDEYQRVGITPFQAMAVRLSSGEHSIATPPIVEIHDGNPIVIGGTTRTKFCCDRKIQWVHCIEVTGAHDPLPGSPVPIDQVSVSKRSLEPAERMENFDYRRFRHIERAVRPY